MWQSGWYWVPVAPHERMFHYSPALVAFVGGSGWSASVRIGGGGYVGWFPLAPADPFIPWWGARRSGIDTTRITYVHRDRCTVVDHMTFVGSRPVMKSYIRDENIVRRVRRAPVLHWTIPDTPTNASFRLVRGEGDVRAVVRPPARFSSRFVMTRMTPPPAPARFREKITVIERNHAPIPWDGAAKIGSDRRSNAAVPVRPVSRAAIAALPRRRLHP
jgi:hypothetical protein